MSTAPAWDTSILLAGRPVNISPAISRLHVLSLILCCSHVHDVLPSDFSASCFACLAEMPINNVQRGTIVEANCRQCHAKLAVRFEAVELQVITAPDVPAGLSHKKHGNAAGSGGGG